jgi:hypothetical protein
LYIFFQIRGVVRGVVGSDGGGDEEEVVHSVQSFPLQYNYTGKNPYE